jgi:hypothetical protein
MKSVAGGTLLALILFVVGGVLWTEANTTSRLATAHQRLSTLHYDLEDDLDEGLHIVDRLPVEIGSSTRDIAYHRATVSYWRARYDSLLEMVSGREASAPADSQLLLLAANAAYREAALPTLEKKAAVEKLDTIIQSYAEVLRKDPALTDAAYNYELAVRIREAVAKGPATRPRDKKAAAAPPTSDSIDLPAGPTIHGRPGGPPEGTDMSDFKTISPMRYDEREEQMDPGRGQQLRRKG